nr:DUF4097 family beta strand repeat-containing protein [uncultured Actinoplanes sp.]
MTTRFRLVLVAAAATTTLTGCAGVLGARMTYEDIEKTKITEIRVSGGSGDVTVRSKAEVTQTAIKRIVRGSSNPRESYRLDGTALLLDTSCGDNCQVSYEIEAPAGVAVRGGLRSGDVTLAGVGATDLQLTSGDMIVKDATGPVKLRATSGDIKVLTATSTVTVQSTSGDIEARNVAGAVDLQVTSGDITAERSTVGSVRAQATSGDVRVIVPAGRYQVTTDTRSGDDSVIGVTRDPSAKAVIDVRTRSGDATVSAAP